MQSDRMTSHFTVGEFDCHDGTSYPSAWIGKRLAPLCMVLETIRAVWQRPVTVLSGYRTPEYNRRIGGATLSQHCQGRAADIIVDGISVVALHAAVLQLYEQGTINIGGLGRYPTFVHVDIREGTHLAQWTGARISNVAPDVMS